MANVASALRKMGADTHVIMTENATKFITPLTFETLTNNRCVVDTFARDFQYDVAHVSLAKAADVILIAPATANVIAKLAHGLADDMLTTTVLAARCPKLIAPAMNTAMLENPATQENLSALGRYGFTVIDPAVGLLACQDVGPGKLPEPEALVEAISMTVAREKDLAGVRVTVTAGPTQEALDPVRYLTNHSTGKMGYAIAREAALRGAEVTLISGPVSLKTPAGHPVAAVSAQDMFEAVKAALPETDILVMSAAVADYRPRLRSGGQNQKAERRYVHSPGADPGNSHLGQPEPASGAFRLRLLHGNPGYAGKLPKEAAKQAPGHDRCQQSEDGGCRLWGGYQRGDHPHPGGNQGAAPHGESTSGPGIAGPRSGKKELTMRSHTIRNRSLTSGSIPGSILLFALPLFLGQLLQQFYNMADAWVIGNFASNNAFAAVSSGGQPDLSDHRLL